MDKTILTMVIVWVVIGVWGTFSIFKYDLGLVKPKFSAGTCIARPLSNEFQNTLFDYNAIVKVGKKDYLMSSYSNETGDGLFTEVKSIEFTDKDYQKVKCPDRIQKIFDDSFK